MTAVSSISVRWRLLSLKVPGKTILDNLEGHANTQHVTALVGASGSGKSSLLYCLANIKQHASMTGHVTWNNQPVQELPTEVNSLATFVPQHDVLGRLHSLTVEQFLMYAMKLYCKAQTTVASRRGVISRYLLLLDLTGVRHSRIFQLSGGQRRRVIFASRLVVRPRVVFMDEPTTGLDATASLTVLQNIYNVSKSGATIVCVLHNIDSSCLLLMDRLYLLHLGRRVFFGSQHDVLPLWRTVGLVPHSLVNPFDFMLDTMTEVSAMAGKRRRVSLLDIMEKSLGTSTSTEDDLKSTNIDRGRGEAQASFLTRVYEASDVYTRMQSEGAGEKNSENLSMVVATSGLAARRLYVFFQRQFVLAYTDMQGWRVNLNWGLQATFLSLMSYQGSMKRRQWDFQSRESYVKAIHGSLYRGQIGPIALIQYFDTLAFKAEYQDFSVPSPMVAAFAVYFFHNLLPLAALAAPIQFSLDMSYNLASDVGRTLQISVSNVIGKMYVALVLQALQMGLSVEIAVTINTLLMAVALITSPQCIHPDRVPKYMRWYRKYLYPASIMDDVALKLAFDDRNVYACYMCDAQYHGPALNNRTEPPTTKALDDALNGDFIYFSELLQHLDDIDFKDRGFVEARDLLQNKTTTSCLASISESESLRYTSDDGDVHALPAVRKSFLDQLIRGNAILDATPSNWSGAGQSVDMLDFVANYTSVACCVGANYDVTIDDFVDSVFVDLTEKQLSLTGRNLKGASYETVGSRLTGQCFEVNSSVCFSMYGEIVINYPKCYDEHLGNDVDQFPCKDPTPVDECDEECFKYGYEYAKFKGFIYDFDFENLTPVVVGSIVLIAFYLLAAIKTFNA